MFNFIPKGVTNASCAQLHGSPLARGMNATEYTAHHAGLMVKMLAGQEDGYCGFENYCVHDATGEPYPETPNDGYAAVGLPLGHCYTGEQAPVPNVPLAIERLDGFAFVGLEEEWSLSICLFHLMLGGECLAVEGRLTRPGGETNAGVDMDELKAADPYDEALYSAVKARFYRDVVMYNATQARCQQLCPGFPPSSFQSAPVTGAGM